MNARSGFLALLMTAAAAHAQPTPAASVRGVVSSVDGNIIHLTNGLIAIDASAAKIVWNGNPVKISAARKGSHVNATLKGTAFAVNVALPATTIDVQKASELTFVGPVKAVDTENSTLMLLDQTIQVNGQTSFDPSLKRLADVHPKQAISVEANRSGNQLVAVTVAAMPIEPDVEGMENMAAVTGVVSSVDGNIIRLANGGVAIDASSATEGILEQKPFKTSSLKPGSRILVNLKTDAVRPNKPLPGEMIDIPASTDVTMAGMATAVDTEHGTFTLLGQTIHIDAQTKFYSELTADQIHPQQLFHLSANRHGMELVAVSVGKWIPELD
jgi:hypothetical protein